MSRRPDNPNESNHYETHHHYHHYRFEGTHMAWNLDFTGTTIDDVDKSAGPPPDGYYYARVESTEESLDDGSQSFVFLILKGRCAGKKQKTKINNPAFADDQKKAAAAAKKAQLYAVRLGLVDKGVNGKTASLDWSKAVGKEVVIQIKTQHFTGSDGAAREWRDLAFDGIWPADHADVTNDIRVAAGLEQRADLPAAGTKPAKGGNSGREPAPAKAPQTQEDLAKALFGG